MAFFAAPFPRPPQPTNPTLIMSLPAACAERDKKAFVAPTAPTAAVDFKKVRRGSADFVLSAGFEFEEWVIGRFPKVR